MATYRRRYTQLGAALFCVLPWLLQSAPVVLLVNSLRAEDEIAGGHFRGKPDGNREVDLVVGTLYGSAWIEGFEYYRDSNTFFLLEGDRSQDGVWRFDRLAVSGDVAGSVRGRALKDAFEGTWLSADGTSSGIVRLQRLSPERDPRNTPEIRRESGSFAERAFGAVLAKDFSHATLLLKLYRLTNHDRPHTEDWESLFESENAGTANDLYLKLRACNPNQPKCSAMQGPLAYLHAQHGQIAAARRIYSTICRKDPYSTNSPPFTCLMYAAFSEQTGDMVGMLMGYDFACGLGSEKLPFACQRSYGEGEIRLIDDITKGNSTAALADLPLARNVNAQNGRALYEAVLLSLTEVVQQLLARGADPNLFANQILTNAIFRDQAITRLLLDHGAVPDSQALYAAVDTNNASIAEELIRKGADVNYDDFVGRGTALMGAVEDGRRQMVSLLLRYGADPTIEAKFHDRPLKSATDPQIKRMLVQALAECRSTRKCEGQP
jgi:ankyrin repeat protein